ncbi:MAG: hypothetical protein EOO06_09255 [Chitinophagaceae bacterium]|nr:MAG: hypothetical protein EOO06_09255 [Chitinophagaceae bacterium]
MEPVLIGVIDFILVPLYFVLLLAIVIGIKKRNRQNKLIQQYLVKGFLCKMFGCLLYGLLILFYWGFGDTATYFKEILVIKQLLNSGSISVVDVFFKDYSFFREQFELRGAVNESGFLVVKIGLILSYLGFNSFLVCSMLMGTLALAGIFKLFETFVSFAPRWHFFIACIVLFFPSINIYGSGILKDTLCYSALGWFFYSCINISRKQQVVASYAIILVSLYFIVVIKAYIIAGFAIPFIFFLIIGLVKKIEIKLFRLIAMPVLLLLVASIFYLGFDKINNALGEFAVEKITDNVSTLQNNYAELTENADSNFDIGEIEPSVLGIIKKMPVGMVATLYRPFLWEVRKPIMLLSALESLFMLLFALYVFKKTGPGYFFGRIISDPIVFLCLGYSIIFSGLVGISALNFGTLARYRIPVIPFYFMGFLLILYQWKLTAQKKWPENEEG